ncbi:MAG: DUF2330 domain-containing protein [Verrucomicrobiota bacterium]
MKRIWIGWTMVVLGCLNVKAPADPCGMVPPMMLTPGSPELVRVGDQLTFVFFKDGVQDIALRPGFKGKLTNFGMLIPFPVPPDIRKVPDPIFSHIRKAIEPPEVVIDLRILRVLERAAAPSVKKEDADFDNLRFGTVKVIKEEAVGMYQVAVLEAENPRALEHWMTTHDYVYPKGMDDVCAEYIESKWCFVAVKANVGNKAAVEPRPGMRKADPSLDDSAAFEGAVQAMGFRFRIDKPVVPMRLSAFNGGELHNIIYYFGEEDVRVTELPADFVQGKISGSQLLKNLTEPLPVKVLGGTLKDAERAGMLNRPQYNRDPKPHNGHALDLFSANLLAVKTGQLTHPFEKREKELLKIGERLGLRGEQVDQLIGEVIAAERKKALAEVQEDFEGMTLTVIEGDFPRDVIAKVNLTFEPFKAKQLSRSNRTAPVRQVLAASGSLLFCALVFMGLRNRRRIVLLPLAMGLVLTVSSNTSSGRNINTLLTALSEPETSETAAASLIAHGKDAVTRLIGEAVEGRDYNRRGWTIVCLADIGDKQAVDALRNIVKDVDSPALVKMWAGAALTRIRGAEAIVELLREQARDPSRQSAVAGLLLGMRTGAVRPLVDIALRGETTEDRQMATSWLGTLDQRLPGKVVKKVLLNELSYSAERARKGVPWAGGALFLPQSAWDRNDALSLSRHLLCWMLHAESRRKKDIARQLANNLRDLSWRNGLGLRQSQSGLEWTRMLLQQAGLDPDAVSKKTAPETLILIVQLMGRE